MTPKFTWPLLLSFIAIALALAVSLRSDLAHVRQVSSLAMQGSRAPARDANSPTGYVQGQRHFLGIHERGETYRWIAATQDVIANGPLGEKTYMEDSVPVGRPSLMPRLYAFWLVLVSWCLGAISGEPVGLAVERAAFWEPVISHVLIFTAAVVVVGRRYGLAGAAAVALSFAFFPPISGQFLPGVLSPRTWALFLGAYALALALPQPPVEGKNLAISVRSALAAGFALWLDPGLGFPVVAILAAVGTATYYSQQAKLPVLKWSLIGSGVTLVAWTVDGAPWSPSAGELRYVHPYYALAWLGLGLALHSIQSVGAERHIKRALAPMALTAALIFPLLYTQLKHAYAGWLYPSVWLRRITSLDETVAYASIRDWLSLASPAEIFFVSAPVALAAALLTLAIWQTRAAKTASAQHALIPAAVLLTILLVLAFFRVRWSVIATLVAVPLIWHLAGDRKLIGKAAVAAVSFILLLGPVVWRDSMPASFQRPAGAVEPRAADFEALVHRHFAHWLATHTPGQNVSALAPPELSDSLVFHGGSRVLMSTAWESYPGQLAVNRILSALESTEAEAVIQGHELTHIILPSWDKVLPLFVQKPAEPGKDTLFDRLNRWVYPPFLRPIPYRIPPLSLFDGQKLAVFKVTPPQDEALSLSRLAEYFVEMDRTEPANLAARALAESFPDDPHAAIARATVYAHGKKKSEFESELSRLVADAVTGTSQLAWDQRVQRAILLALGRQHDLARKEVEACINLATQEDLFELTSLQAYRLHVLVQGFRLSFADTALSVLLKELGAEFSAISSESVDR